MAERARAVEVRKTGWKVNWEEIGAGRRRGAVDVVSARRDVVEGLGRWARVRRARRARGEIN